MKMANDIGPRDLAIPGDGIALDNVNKDFHPSEHTHFEKVVEHSHNADEALNIFAGHEGEVFHIDEATNRRLLRIIDWNLLPLSKYIPLYGAHAKANHKQCVWCMV